MSLGNHKGPPGMAVKCYLLADFTLFSEDLFQGRLKQVGGCVMPPRALPPPNVNLCHHLHHSCQSLTNKVNPLPLSNWSVKQLGVLIFGVVMLKHNWCTKADGMAAVLSGSVSATYVQI